MVSCKLGKKYPAISYMPKNKEKLNNKAKGCKGFGFGIEIKFYDIISFLQNFLSQIL